MGAYKRNWIIPKGHELTEMDRKILYYQERGSRHEHSRH